MKKFTTFFSIFFLFVLIACQAGKFQQMPDESEMQYLFMHDPDTLAFILENITNPSDLPPAGKANYGFWLAKAHKKQQRSLINDTLIHFALNYYKHTGSPRLQEAYLLAEDQLNWSGKLMERITILEEALFYYESKNDTAFINNVSSELIKLYSIPEDTVKVNELIRLTMKYLGGKDDRQAYYNLSRQYSALNQIDSVVKYARHGYELIDIETDPWLNYALARSYVESLSASGKGYEALTVLENIENKMPVGNELKLNYISTWISLGKFDSAKIYMDSVQVLIDKYRFASPEETFLVEMIILMYQTIIQAKEGKQISYFELGSTPDNILALIRRMIINDRERLMVENKLIKKNLMLDIEKATLHQRILWLSIFILLLVIIIIYFYHYKLLQKERTVQKAKNQLQKNTIRLAENEELIQKNKAMVESFMAQAEENDELRQEINRINRINETLQQTNKTLQKDIDRFSNICIDNDADTYEKIIRENARLQERERFLTNQVIAHTEILNRLSIKNRYIDESQWPDIIHAINQLFDGFSYRLHSDFPSLTEEDIRYCCLFKLRLSNSVIANLTGISPSSVTKRKQRIKEKISNQQFTSGIRKEQPLEIFLWNY